MARKQVGKVKHYFSNVGVAVVALDGALSAGDDIEIEKEGNVVKQKVESMQVEHKKIDKAKKGMEIGLKVNEPVKVNSLVYKV